MTENTLGSMVGRTISQIDGGLGAKTITLVADDGTRFVFWHEQDCCESVRVEDIAGDLNDLIGMPLLLAEEVSSSYPHEALSRLAAPPPPPQDLESYTWTFYRFATAKGYVTIRWLGSSNGHYSESVSFREEAA